MAIKFHRLTLPTYVDGLPATHDYINNLLVGAPALADGAKVGGVNAGTYFDAFGEDATSSNANRSNAALAQNCDFLDDVVSAATPVLTSLVVNNGAPRSSAVLTGDIWVGQFGTANSQYERDKLITVVDSATGNDLIDSTGTRVQVTLIEDGAGNNVVGTSATGFYHDPTVNFTPAIPIGICRVYYGYKNTLAGVADASNGIGAFIGNDIRTAQIVPAESTRYMREASRRSAGAVAALAATVIETPGVGDNILAASHHLTVDIDPAGTLSADGQGTFTVQFQRDTAPVKLFEVEQEDTSVAPHPASWTCEDGTLGLRDKNVISAFAVSDQYTIPLSSSVAAAGDSYLRLAEYPHASPGTQPTILRSLNARACVTVGDGVSTFGDFNGVTGVADALNFYWATPGSGDTLHVLIKPGTYEMAGISYGASHVILEGVSHGVTLANSGLVAGVAAIEVGTAGSLTIKNCTIIKKAGGAYISYVFLTQTAGGVTKVRLENCTINGQYLALSAETGIAAGKDVFIATDCAFVATATYPCVELGVVSAARGYKFRDCTFVGAANSPVLKVIDGGLGSAQAVHGILFERCRMQLGSTTTAAGDLVGNPGVLQVVIPANDFLGINDITWKDCHVTANYLTTGANSILLHLPCNTAAGNYISIGKIKIHGGTWECPAEDTEIAPFYVGHRTYTSNNDFVQVVDIEDVDWGFVGASGYGVGVADSSYVAGFFAATYISASKLIRVHNLRITCATINANGATGELWLKSPDRYDVKGVFLHNYVAGSSTPPAYRVLVEGATTYGSYGSIQEVVVDARSWSDHPCSTGVIGVVPNGQLLLDNCTIKCPSGSKRNGFILLAGNAAQMKGLRLTHCYAESCTYGISVETSAAAVIGGLEIVDCTVTQGTVGVYFSFNSYFEGLRILGNSVYANTAIGVVLEPSSWPINVPGASAGFRSMVFNNNNIYNNQVGGTGPAGIQMQFGEGLYKGLTPTGVFMGNTFGSGNPSSAPGQVRIVILAGVPADGIAQDSYCIGLGTNYYADVDLGTGHGTVTTLSTSGVNFLHNIGQLVIS